MVKRYISLLLYGVMCNLITMKKMMSYSLLITNIDKIGLCAAGLEVRLHYLVHHVDPEPFNIQKSLLNTEKSIVGLVIPLSKSEMTQKRNFITATPNIKHDQVISKTFNARLQSMKMLMMIKI